MPKKEVIEYIEKQLKKGHHINKIKHKLISAGHRKPDVEEHVAHVHERRLSLKMFFVVLVIFIVIVVVFYYEDRILVKEKGEEEIVQESREAATQGKVMIDIVAREEEEPIQEEPGEELPEGLEEEQPKELSCEEKCEGNERCIIICENPDVINKAMDENDLNVCEQLSQNAKNVCRDAFYLRRAMVEGNVELCNNVIEEDSKVSCFDDYYHQKAISAKDLSYCEKIINSELKSSCEGK